MELSWSADEYFHQAKVKENDYKANFCVTLVL